MTPHEVPPRTVLDARGWTEAACRALGIGWDGTRVLIPTDGERPLRYWPVGEPTDGRRKMDAPGRVPRRLFPPPENVPADGWTFIVEGEGDAIAATSIGLHAVGVPGTSSWKAEWATRFAGRCVVVVGDCDAAGRRMAERIATDLYPVAADLRIVELDLNSHDGHDLSDVVREAGADARDLIVALATNAPSWRPASTSNGVTRHVRLRTAADVDRERVDWAWHGRVPLGMVTLLAGEAGLGKSTLTCLLAAQASRGGLPGALFGNPCDVLMATAEDSLSVTMRPRLEAAGADLSRVHFLEVTTGEDTIAENITLPTDVWQVARLARDTGARLLVVDPLVAHLADDTKTNNDHSVRRAVGPLVPLAEELGVAVVCVVHLNKADHSHALHRIGGSVAFGAGPRSVLLFARDPEDEAGEAGYRRVVAHVKCNVGPYAPSLAALVEAVALDDPAGPIETSRLVVTGESDQLPSGLLARRGDDESRSQMEEAEEFLRSELGASRRLAREVQAAAVPLGISKTTLTRAKKTLKIESSKDAFDGAWYWALPTSHEGDQGLGHLRAVEDVDHLRANPPPVPDHSLSATGKSIEGSHLWEMRTFGADGATEASVAAFLDLGQRAGYPRLEWERGRPAVGPGRPAWGRFADATQRWPHVLDRAIEAARALPEGDAA